MALSKADLEALAGLMDSKIAAAVAPVATQESAPAVAKDTAGKAKVVRKLDPIEVPGSDTVTFKIVPHSHTGSMYTRGARVVPQLDGKTYRSLDAAMIEALAGDGVLDAITTAIETVNKRALLGAHAPKVAQES